MNIENNSLLIALDSLLEEKMLTIRGQHILLDTDMASLYQIRLSYLRRIITQNILRFPEPFMFALTHKEILLLFPGGTKRKKIFAFSWGGIVMAAGQFHTQRAVELHLQLIRSYSKYAGGDIFKMLAEL